MDNLLMGDGGMLGVIPVVVNVGAAIIPALIGGITQAAAILFKPKELLRLCKRKPYVPAIAAGVGVALYFLISWLAAAPALDRTKSEKLDWADVAREVIARKEMATAQAVAQTDRAVIYRHDPSRSGFDGGQAPTQLLFLWSFKEDFTMYLSSPAAYGESVFGASCLLDPPNNYGALFCLDRETGRRKWYVDQVEITGADGKPRKYDLKGFFSSPAVTGDGKYVVIGQGLHEDWKCNLLCFEAQTGKLHWMIPTPLHLESSPAVHGDLVVIGAGAVEGGDRKPIVRGDEYHRGFVLAVRISDGKELWRHRVADPESSPVIDENGVCYVGSGFNGNAVVALRTESDEELQRRGLPRQIWSTPTPHPATGAVTLASDLLLIGCGNGDYVFRDPNPAGAIVALDRGTGKLAWELEMPDAVLGAVAVRGNVAVCPIANGEVVAVDLAKAAQAIPNDQKILWRTRISGKAPVLAGPAFTGTYVYAVSKDGYLAVIRASDGAILEKHYINDPLKAGELGLCVSSPLVAGGRVFVGTETGGFRCLPGRTLE